MADIHPDLPALRDLDFGDFAEDLAFYENLARRSEGSVLELGVGTGRVAIALAEQGFEVWGLDTSRAMLDRARSKASPELAACLHLEEADMRDFNIDRKFALIFAAYGTFPFLLTEEEQASCLACVQEHLAPGGLFVCDLRPLHHDPWEPGESVPLLHDWTRSLPDSGETVTMTRAVRNDAARQVRHQTNIYDLMDGSGNVRRVIEEVDLRFTTRYEMEGLLRKAGLELDQVYGDYDLAPFDDGSAYMITVARKPEDS